MKLREFLIYGFCLAAGALFATAAAAERRVALVIGNSTYKNAPSLSNTINDSTAITALFKSVGFEVVISRTDLGVVDFKRSVREFLITAENADMAVVYYAGHGIEVDGANYLIPVDAKLERDTDVYDEALSLDRVLLAIEPAKKLRLVILDACRDNPFSRNMKRTVASRAIGQGLAKVANREGVFVNFGELTCFDGVFKFLMVMVDFFPDAIERVGNLNFCMGLAFLVFMLSGTGLSGK